MSFVYLIGVVALIWAPETKGEPLPEKGPIELQHHGDHLEFKNIYIKEL